MRPAVQADTRASPERLPALLARERLLPAVDALAANELGRALEGLETLAARVGLVAAVGAPVLEEVGAATEGFPTLRTQVPLVGARRSSRPETLIPPHTILSSLAHRSSLAGGAALTSLPRLVTPARTCLWGTSMFPCAISGLPCWPGHLALVTAPRVSPRELLGAMLLL